MAIPNWFDSNVYMSNKLAQLKEKEPAGNWDAFKVADAFIQAGFAGEEGAQRHFMEFGQTEDVAPNPFFNAMEYYYAKAAHVLGIDAKNVTPENAAMVKNAIKDLGMNAWSHYETFGSNEKVNPSNGFDTEKYMNAKLEALNANLAADQPRYEIKDVYAAFQASGISALEHFMTFGGNGAAGEVAQKYDPKNPTIPAEFAVDDVKKVHPSGGTGESVPFTLGEDNLVGTAGDDIFVARADSGGATLQSMDKVDGKGGTDTLRVIGADAGAFGFHTAGISNIEKIEIMGALGNASNKSLAADQVAGVKEFWLSSVTATTAALDVSIGSGQTLGVSGTFDGFNDAASLNVTFADKADAKMQINNAVFTDATDDGITAAGVSKMTISAAGKNMLGDLTVADLDTLILTGEGSVEMGTINAKNTGLKLVDATGLKGGADLILTVADLSTVDTAKTVIKGGVGNDSIEFTADASGAIMDVDLGDGDNTFMVHTGVNAKTTVKAGAGTNDTLILDTIGTAIDGTTGKYFTGFENVALTGNGTYEHGSIAGIQNISLDAAAATYVLKNIGNIDVQIGSDATDVAITSITANSGVSKGTLNLTLDNQADADAVGVVITTLITTDATLNITSTGMTNATHNKITGDVTSTSLKDINITGDQAIDLVLDAASVAIKTIDASGLAVKKDAAGIDVTLADMAGNQTDIVITGSVGNDKLTVVGTAGDDAYTFNATLGGTDAIAFTGAAANDSLTVAHDGKALANLSGASVNVAGAANGSTAVDTGGVVVVDLTADIAKLLTRGGVKQADVSASATADIGALRNEGDAFGEGNTFVLDNTSGKYILQIDANGDGKFNAADDFQVTIVGDANSTYAYNATTGDFTFTSAS